MKKLLAVIPILAVIIIADYFYSKYHVAPDLNFSALSLTTLDGEPITLSSIKGKKLFLFFFGTSSGSSVKQVPSLEMAQSKLNANNFCFICISDEPVDTLKKFKQLTNFHLPMLHLKQKLSDLNILTLPTSYILNTKGELVYKKTGERDWEDEDIIHELQMSSE
jgi:peroxiredoxin